MLLTSLRAMMRLVAPALFLFFAACATGSSEVRASSGAGPATTGTQPSGASGDRVVWTAIENKAVRARVGVHTLAYPFTRLDVLGGDGTALAVICRVCSPAVTGYIDPTDLITAVDPVDVAALGDLPAFALAVRDAAARHDLDALLPVMAPDFTYDFIGIQTPEAAFAVWRAEEFLSLDQVPGLLDQGLASDDRVLWVSPPRFLTDLSYRGPRLGFRRRSDGRWEWLFLIRGIR